MYNQSSFRLFKNSFLLKNSAAFSRCLHSINGTRLCSATKNFDKKLSGVCCVPSCVFHNSNVGLCVNFSPSEPKYLNGRLILIPKRQKAGGGYTNFGHARDKPNAYQYLLGIFGFVMCCSVLYMGLFNDADGIQMDVKASSIDNEEDGSKSVDSAEETDDDESGSKEIKKKKKQDRIRAYSAPEKVFRYFATLKVYAKNEVQHGPHFEVFMTPEDFVRSISPGVLQPDGLGLEQFAVFDPEKDKVHSRYSLDPDSVFYHLGKHGLISLTDYIFLLTVLSTSARHFALAFKMFDINGDGELDYKEFELVELVIKKQTSTGLRQSATGNISRHQTSSSLAKYFFGQSLDQKLTIERFLEFQEHLQRDILKLEFKRREPVDNRISEVSFCKMLLQHSGLSEKTQQKMIKRVKRYYKAEEKRVGVSLVDVEEFFRFLNNISDVDTALTFYHMAGASVDAPTLQHVASSVAGVKIPDHMIEIVFALFDENHDGELSNREFVNIMKKRLMRGLERPKDTGIPRKITAMFKCALERGYEKRAYRSQR